jgi:hypothetical protein
MHPMLDTQFFLTHFIYFSFIHGTVIKRISSSNTRQYGKLLFGANKPTLEKTRKTKEPFKMGRDIRTIFQMTKCL